MTEKEITELYKVRHSLAHILAMAARDLDPELKLAIGPVIDTGFYYDFDLTKPLAEGDLKELQKKMKKLISGNIEFSGEEVTADEAREIFKDEPYKLELIDEFESEDKKLTVFKSGNFTDLCAGGHVENTKEINIDAFKIDKLAGAYWRGDEKNKMLTRVYGLAFENKDELEAFESQRKEAEKRDHRKLGKQLDLFVNSELVGPGLPLFTPRGTLLRNLLDDYVWELRKEYGYEQVDIPHITKQELYETSGHWDKFGDELFAVKSREGHEFIMKPMNCPHHTQIYDRKIHSYKELPVRYANTTKVYRDEQTGELAGLARVRSITQDDAHVFCRKDQIREEFEKIWGIVTTFYGTVGFTNITATLSLSDPEDMEKYMGEKEVWSEAEEVLRTIAGDRQKNTKELLGEAAFYGPKVDFLAIDSIGRQWQLATIQLDMMMPERFNLTCTNENGEKERIVMIHAAIMGSLERFLSVYIEHVGGNFPLWLAPTQIAVLPIAETHNEYAIEVTAALDEVGIRASLLKENETLGKKIKNVKESKIPYFVVLGDAEVKNKTVTLETRDGKEKEELSVEGLVTKLSDENKAR